MLFNQILSQNDILLFQNDLNVFQKLCDDNGMLLNIEKCVVISYTLKK